MAIGAEEAGVGRRWGKQLAATKSRAASKDLSEREKRIEEREGEEREVLTGGPVVTWRPRPQNHPAKQLDGQI